MTGPPDKLRDSSKKQLEIQTRQYVRDQSQKKTAQPSRNTSATGLPLLHRHLNLLLNRAQRIRIHVHKPNLPQISNPCPVPTKKTQPTGSSPPLPATPPYSAPSLVLPSIATLTLSSQPPVVHLPLSPTVHAFHAAGCSAAPSGIPSRTAASSSDALTYCSTSSAVVSRLSAGVTAPGVGRTFFSPSDENQCGNP